jgi:hypothetical protein
VPASLDRDAVILHAMLTTISNGTPVDPTPAQYAALTSFDQWGHGACGFTRLDVTNTATGLAGVPPALPAGTGTGTGAWPGGSVPAGRRPGRPAVAGHTRCARAMTRCRRPGTRPARATSAP